jgi:hypothetical protein
MGHLEDIKESYFEHFRHAFNIGSVLILASLGQFLHSVLPNVSPPYGSDIDSLIGFLNSMKTENRKDV